MTKNMKDCVETPLKRRELADFGAFNVSFSHTSKKTGGSRV